jgi:mannose-6-phosphate isomerase-like protein (cupin superfamily)
MNICSNKTPFVLFYFPAPNSRASGPATSERISTRYIDAGEFYGCDAVKDGTYVQVDLKSIPAKSTFSDDAVKVDPTHNEILIENDRVRVVRIHFAPGESGPMVDKRSRVIVAVTDSHASVTFPDGHSETRDVKAGSVSFGNAGRQATRNTGTTPLENIVIELKSKDSEKK